MNRYLINYNIIKSDSTSSLSDRKTNLIESDSLILAKSILEGLHVNSGGYTYSIEYGDIVSMVVPSTEKSLNRTLKYGSTASISGDLVISASAISLASYDGSNYRTLDNYNDDLMILTDNISGATAKGVHYLIDYSASWDNTTPDSILSTKGYVDNKIVSLTQPEFTLVIDSASDVDVDLSLGNNFTLGLTESVSFQLSNLPAENKSFIIEVEQLGSGNYTIAFDSGSPLTYTVLSTTTTIDSTLNSISEINCRWSYARNVLFINTVYGFV